MSDYIKRENAVSAFRRLEDDDWNQGTMTTWARAFGEAADMLECATAADVVEVVRCKDCEWYEIAQLKADGTDDRRYKPSLCTLLGQTRNPTYYCADGERRGKE